MKNKCLPKNSPKKGCHSSERVIKDVLNNLELDQLNLLDKSIEQLLLSEKIAEQNFEWNNSILFVSNLDSDIYDYNSVTTLIP